MTFAEKFNTANYDSPSGSDKKTMNTDERPGRISSATNEADRRGIGFVLSAMLLSAMAGGLGWGIRGQYGHGTGAMIAGSLTGFTLVLLFARQASSLAAARAVAMMTVAIGIGGSMTYGQTLGLTHDAPLIGNWPALRWGMFGLFIKGGIWIGFAGAFLGMGLGGKRYRLLEISLLMLALFGIMFLGIWWLNSPFDPDQKLLPRFYFSDDWYWEPDGDVNPREELWGGLLLGWMLLTCYIGLIRRDRLGRNMAVVGFLAGGLGFSGGQCIQAYHAWNIESFTNSSHAEFFQQVNWWSAMETAFGMIFGAILALGLWCNRRHIAIGQGDEEVVISPPWEVFLVSVHLILLLTAEFLKPTGDCQWIEGYTDYGIPLATIPMIGVIGGRFWPYLLPLPIVAAPICGKTLRNLVYENDRLPPDLGWIFCVGLPLTIVLCGAVRLIVAGQKGGSARQFASIGLWLTAWLFFGLSFGFLEFPWPGTEWGGRAIHGTIFAICTLGLTLAALMNFCCGPASTPNPKRRS